MKFSRNNVDCFQSSGDEGIRTPDPLLARQVLSQLSYTPILTADLSSCLCFVMFPSFLVFVL